MIELQNISSVPLGTLHASSRKAKIPDNKTQQMRDTCANKMLCREAQTRRCIVVPITGYMHSNRLKNECHKTLCSTMQIAISSEMIYTKFMS